MLLYGEKKKKKLELFSTQWLTISDRRYFVELLIFISRRQIYIKLITEPTYDCCYDLMSI